MNVERVIHGGEILAVIIRRDFSSPGVQFFTPNDFSQQLGYMQHPVGRIIQPHIHTPVQREVTYTQEVLFIRRGKLRVDFYSRAKEYIESRTLQAGDVILLASAGHGFEVVEDVEMLEVKQGPYAEHEDKERFNGIASGDALFREGHEQ
jgi:mannose-6-phosphate isomerase-like protein (cupin superfamily)